MGADMKMAARMAGLALMAALAFPAVGNAASAKQDFDLVNKTGYDISHVYVSPTKTNDWEEDVLGKDVLENNDSWEIKFDRTDNTCKWDLKVVYADDNSSAVWKNIDLCTVEEITIRYNRKNDTTSASFK